MNDRAAETMVERLTDQVHALQGRVTSMRQHKDSMKRQRDAFEALYKGRADVATFIAERDEARVQREEYGRENEQLRSERDDLMRGLDVAQKQRTAAINERDAARDALVRNGVEGLKERGYRIVKLKESDGCETRDGKFETVELFAIVEEL